MGQKNNAMTEYGHVTNKYVHYIITAILEKYGFFFFFDISSF